MVQIVGDERVQQTRVGLEDRRHFGWSEGRSDSVVDRAQNKPSGVLRMVDAIMVADGGLDAHHPRRVLPATPAVYPVGGKAPDEGIELVRIDAGALYLVAKVRRPFGVVRLEEFISAQRPLRVADDLHARGVRRSCQVRRARTVVEQTL